MMFMSWGYFISLAGLVWLHQIVLGGGTGLSKNWERLSCVGCGFTIFSGFILLSEGV